MRDVLLAAVLFGLGWLGWKYGIPTRERRSHHWDDTGRVPPEPGVVPDDEPRGDGSRRLPGIPYD